MLYSSFFILLVCAYSREVISFDADWLFLLGDGGYREVCDTAAFSMRLNNTFCHGSTMIFVSTRELCEEACCGDPTCLIYQWCEQPCVPRSPGWGCYNGNQCSSNVTGAENWTSFARTQPAPTPPPPSLCVDPALPCSVSHPDSAWRTVSTPHDFVDEGAYSPDNDMEHGFLPLMFRGIVNTLFCPPLYPLTPWCG